MNLRSHKYLWKWRIFHMKEISRRNDLINAPQLIGRTPGERVLLDTMWTNSSWTLSRLGFRTFPTFAHPDVLMNLDQYIGRRIDLQIFHIERGRSRRDLSVFWNPIHKVWSKTKNYLVLVAFTLREEKFPHFEHRISKKKFRANIRKGSNSISPYWTSWWVGCELWGCSL